MTSKRMLYLALIILLASFASQAAPILTLNYQGYPQGLNDGSYYVGLAKGDLVGDGQDPFFMWCISSLRHVTNPETVYVMDIAEAAASGYGYTAPELKAMAILGNEFNNHNPNDSQVQHAIWSILDHRTLTTAEQGILNAATASIGNFDYSGVKVLIPVNFDIGQPFMTGNTTAAPEPASMALIGGGLIAGACFLKRRNRALARNSS